ncbi:MAG: site-specific integrase [Firmicutes bacterium]|nr:site-specific integrase [Bacillota bacterium]
MKRPHQAEERLAAGAAYQDNGLVFCTHVGTPLSATNLVRRDFHRLLESAGLPPIRFHDLRHTSASLLISQGVHLKVIRARLGHSSVQVTGDVYAHLLPDMGRDAAAKLGDLLLGTLVKKERRPG